MKNLFLITLLLTVSFAVSAQIKPEAMLLQIEFVNVEDVGLQGSLNNYAETVLSTYYDLKSKKDVEDARDSAIDKLTSENCTEDACVKIMGELLDVEYTFKIKIIDTGEGWDFMIMRQDLGGITSRRNEVCENCSLSKSRKTLEGMLRALGPGVGFIQSGKATLILESEPISQVFLNGEDQGNTPLNLIVDIVDPIPVMFFTEGYEDLKMSYILKDGEIQKNRVVLQRKRGKIRIDSIPSGSNILVDGKPKMDSQKKELITPAVLRLVFGEHKLTIKHKNYHDHSENIIINEQDHGSKTIELEPLPGKLLIRVPSKHSSARVYIDGSSVGTMGGKIAKSFKVPANKKLVIYVKDGMAISQEEEVNLGPADTKIVTFERLRILEQDGTRFGLGLEYDSFSLSMEGSGGTNIDASYTITGLTIHGLIFPEKHFVNLSYLNGPGKINEPPTPFMLVSGESSYNITGTYANVLRLIYSNGWEPGWNYSFGWEQIKAYFQSVQGDRYVTIRSPLIEGSYEFSNLIYWLSDFNLSLDSRLRYSFINGIGLSAGLYWTFF
jgi:hypothetical protein